MTNVWQQINESAADAVTTVQQSLVQIVTEHNGIGAGTIWQADGLIITNAHVVIERGRQRRNLEVVLQNGERYPTQILVADEKLDIAALAISAQDLPTIKIGNSSTLEVGEWLMASGHPWGMLDSLTAGVVIGTGNKLPEVGGDTRDWIALDMKMRPGHSGGPLFNHAGEIVGINTMIRGPEVSFAVPVDVVKAFLKRTIGTNKKPMPTPDDVVVI